MYRRTQLAVMFISLLLLLACNSNTVNETAKENNDTRPEEEEQTDENMSQQKTGAAEEKDRNEEEGPKQAEEKPEKEILYELSDTWDVVPLDEDANEKVVLLTIDDAPENHAVEMAATLKELDAPAIFFVNGHFLQTEEGKEALQTIHDMGFAIGNHTYSHQQLSLVDESVQKEEILELSQLIEEIIGEKPKFFRAPHGDNTDFAKELVEDEGMLLMNWTYGYDYFEPYQDAEKLTEAMVTGEGPEVDVPYSLLKPGANLLMHDREWTAAALKDIVNGLREKGYDIVDPETIQLP